MCVVNVVYFSKYGLISHTFNFLTIVTISCNVTWYFTIMTISGSMTACDWIWLTYFPQCNLLHHSFKQNLLPPIETISCNVISQLWLLYFLQLRLSCCISKLCLYISHLQVFFFFIIETFSLCFYISHLQLFLEIVTFS